MRVEPQRAFENVESAIERAIVARIFDAEAGVADRRAIAAERLAEMRIVQTEADMGEIDGDLPRASDSLPTAACRDFVLRNRQ
ncbi:MAG: hypothetical protein JOZ84_11710 [Methylobacteriaceae bacterium]|nr:hypothetical protein [Methylobacteriaceae bacterium]